MEKYKLDKDINVFYVTATSFPDGALEAHEKLHALIPYSLERKYFGISRPENGGEIVYKAAAEELSAGDLRQHGLEEFIIPKGNYISINIENFMQDIPAIAQAFDALTSYKEIDPNGYCIEWYLTDKVVRCMVKLKE